MSLPPEVQCPVCPRCGGPPDPVMPSISGWTQAFCVDDGCSVLMWNPRESALEFEAHAKGIVSETDAAGRTAWRPEAES